MQKAKTVLMVITLLGILEFGLAAFATLQIDPDPKHAFLFGYSAQRLAFFGVILLFGITLIYLAWSTWRGKIPTVVLNILDGQSPIFRQVALVLILIGFLLGVTPYTWLGSLAGYFHRLQPIIVVLFSLPIQIHLVGSLPPKWQSNQSWIRPVVIILGITAMFWLLVLVIRPGPAIPGTPYTAFQWTFALLVTLIICLILILTLARLRTNSWWLDVAILLALTISAGLIWVGTPIKHSSFLVVTPPFYQPYPTSDAGVHDMGAISIIEGRGILFGAYTDKPLYMVFLSVLHYFAGFNYSLLVTLQIWVLALMAPALYWFGKTFHSRSLGLLSAILMIVHQANAIQLTNALPFNSTPNMLMTEVPTLFSIILLTWVCFEWFKKPRLSAALAAGGILGASSLLRLNSALILPFIPAFALLVIPSRKQWLLHSLVYLLGFFILITPWLITGQNSQGNPYFIYKFFDVIHVRYSDTSAPPPIPEEQPLPETTPQLPPHSQPGILDLNRFPGFVIDHFLNNLAGSVYELPSSIQPDDQRMSQISAALGQTAGSFPSQQPAFVIINSILIALGLAWSWRQWKWPGLSPLLIFIVYSLSLAFGRTSGSRYLVPIDWLTVFYFSLGVIWFLGYFLPEALKPEVGPFFAQTDAPAWNSLAINRSFWGVLIGLVILAAFIPVADTILPPDPILCKTDNLNTLITSQTTLDSTAGLTIQKGLILYPTIQNKTLYFDLLSCTHISAFSIKAPKVKFNPGDPVIVGWQITRELNLIH